MTYSFVIKNIKIKKEQLLKFHHFSKRDGMSTYNIIHNSARQSNTKSGMLSIL